MEPDYVAKRLFLALRETAQHKGEGNCTRGSAETAARLFSLFAGGVCFVQGGMTRKEQKPLPVSCAECLYIERLDSNINILNKFTMHRLTR